MQSKFIVLEGPDGAGTTLHSKLLAEQLEKEGHSVLLTAEPTDGPIGKWIREQLNSKKKISHNALQLLFCADRAWHIENVIQLALDAGKIVISDRYAPSTIIYGAALGLNARWLQTVNQGFLKPDLTIFTLPSFEVCTERLARRSEHDMFETTELQQKVYDAYVEYARFHKDVRVVDTTGEKPDVSALIRSLVP